MSLLQCCVHCCTWQWFALASEHINEHHWNIFERLVKIFFFKYYVIIMIIQRFSNFNAQYASDEILQSKGKNTTYRIGNKITWIQARNINLFAKDFASPPWINIVWEPLLEWKKNNNRQSSTRRVRRSTVADNTRARWSRRRK